MNVSRNNKKNNWSPYTSNLQKFSIYPSIRPREDAVLRVGDVLTVDIYDVDERGNGVVYRGNKKIVIPNAISGSRVKIKIIKIQGDVAMAHVIDLLSETNADY